MKLYLRGKTIEAQEGCVQGSALRDPMRLRTGHHGSMNTKVVTLRTHRIGR